MVILKHSFYVCDKKFKVQLAVLFRVATLKKQFSTQTNISLTNN